MSWAIIICSMVAATGLTWVALQRLVGLCRRTGRDVHSVTFRGSLLHVVWLAGVMASPLLAGEPKTALEGDLPPVPSPGPAIRIVYPVVMPPYTFQDEKGEAQGLAIDLLRLWSKRTGTPIEFKSAPWEEGLRLMREGGADAHASLYRSDEREAYLTYAAIVASSQGMVFHHRTVLGLHRPGDLRGFKIGAVQNGYHEQYIKQHLPEAPLVSYPEFPEMLAAAQRGDIRVFVDDAGATLFRLKERGLLDEFRHDPGQVLYRNHFWIAVRKGNAGLAKALEEGLALITPDERAVLERKWLPGSLIRTPGTLFVAISSDNAPFSFVSTEGSPAGFLVDLWKRWAEKTGKRVEFMAGDWEDAVTSVRSGRADIHSGLFGSGTLAQWFDFSSPLLESGSILLFPRQRERRTGEQRRILAGAKISVLQGSYFEQYLRSEHPTVRVMPFVNREKMVRAVLSGDASACLAERFSTEALLSRLGVSGMFDAEPFTPLAQNIQAGIPKGQAPLLSLVNEGLKGITEDEREEMKRRWGLTDQTRSVQRLLLGLLAMAAVAALIVGGLVLWNRGLRRMVNARTAILAENEERLHMAMDASGTGLWSMDDETRQVWASSRERALFALSEGEALTYDHFLQTIHPDDRESVRTAVEAALRTGAPLAVEYRITTPDGSVRWIAARGRSGARREGAPKRLMGIAMDVTERKVAEETLVESQFRLASAVEVADLGFYEVVDGERVSFLDGRAYALTGVPEGQGQGVAPLRFWMEHIHPEDRDRLLDVDQKLNGGMLDRATVDYRYLHPQRGLIWLHHLAHVTTHDADGRAARTIGVFQDVTERKVAEDTLRKSESRLSAAADTAGLGFYEAEGLPDHRVTLPDKRVREVAGIPPDCSDENVRDYWLAHVHPDDVQMVITRARRLDEVGGVDHIEAEYRYRHEGRGLVWLRQVVHVQARDEAGRAIRMIGVMQDITERKLAEQELGLQRLQLAHVSRVAAMGQLTSSLAHELNQPLGAILRNAEAAEMLLEDPTPDLDEVRAILRDIREDDQRAGAVIDRMRDLIKRREVQTVSLDAGLLVGEVIGLVRPEADMRRVEFALETDPALPPVQGDRVQLQQVLLNLLLNAMDAVGDSRASKGRVTVRVRAAEAAVEVSVSDNGRGIPADKLSRIFEPFYTSKPNGLGMGLPICRRIVEAHGGRLWAENQAGGGAVFTFSLPAAGAEERGARDGGRSAVAKGAMADKGTREETGS